MKKKSLLVTILLLLIAVFAFSLTACNNEVGTLESLQNEYGIVVDGGSFEEGSTLVSNEIVATTEEAAEVLAAIADQNYNKDGSVYIFDIYVTKDGKEVQPDGKVKVSIPVPNVEVDNYLVFHVKSENSVESLVPTVADGKISFETSSFSYFVIAEAAIQDAPPIHVHNFEWVEGKESTCKEEGIAPHYHCDGCGKNFDQNYGEIDSVITEKGSHDVGLNYAERMEPTFFDEGTVAYYICNDCLQYISEDGQIIPPTDIFIPPLSLDISVCVNGVPTELALQGDFNGDTAEWKAEGISVKIGDVITVCLTDDPNYKFTFTCDGIVDENGVVTAACEVATVDFYADRSGLRLVMIDPTICEHNYVWVEGKEPTCEEEGVVGHFHCEACGKNFDPNYGEIDSIVIGKLPHDVGLNYAERMEPTFFDEGTVAYYICNDCLQYISEDGQIIPPTNIFIPPLSLDISVCVNGVPTELALQGDFNGDTAEWKAEGLSVKIGDVITVCLTDDPSYKFTFTCDGIVDENGVVTAACEVATVDFYADRSGLRLVMIDPTICEHNYVWVEGKEPTCEEEGIVGHYHCEACGKNFDPNYGEMESISIPKAEHEYGSLYWGNSANFFEDGNIEYYQCSECEKYFDNEYNEVETPVIPKYSTNISICVNGTPTALVVVEQNEGQVVWELDDLSVKEGDVITICQTDNTSITHNYFASGIVDNDGKITVTTESNKVHLMATDNGLMLDIVDIYQGVVIEINGMQYPMDYVTYPDGETKSYIYGYVNLSEYDTFVIIDNVNEITYDYDDLSADFAWDTWDFHRGDNGEFVIDYSARYGIEFDYGGEKKIFINKVFAPYLGNEYNIDFIDEQYEDVPFEGIEIPAGVDVYNELLWYIAHPEVENNEDILSFIGEYGLWVYTATLYLEEGMKFNILSNQSTIINATHLTEVYAESGNVKLSGSFVYIGESGFYTVTYLPCVNSFAITREADPDVYIYCDEGLVPLTKDENNVVTYYYVEATTSTYIAYMDYATRGWLTFTLDSQTDSTVARVEYDEESDMSMLFFDKAGTYNLAYNIDTGVLSITSVGGDESEDTEFDPSNYLYYLSVSGGSGSTQTLTMQVNPTNAKEFCYKGVELTASCFIGVIEMAKDASSDNTYGAIADTDSSIAQSYGTVAMVKIAGTYDIYFDTEAKTIRIVAVS